MKFWQVASFSEPDQLLEIAKGAEAAGFEGVFLSDHLFFPGDLRSKYPYSEDGVPGFDGSTPFPDPWTTIAAMAAVTTRLRFSTMVYILPLRHPLEVAKTVGTVARLSGGRVALGVGAGWIREEYDALGVPFAGRGKRMNEMFEVMRKAWSGAMVEHRGEHFDLGAFQMTPAPEAHVPIWVGGLSKHAFRRAGALGDGWIGTGQHPDEVAGIVEQLQAARREAGREGDPFETIVPLVTPPEPDTLRKLGDAGVTATTCWPFSYTVGPTSTIEQKRDAMMRFADEVISKV
ncbi:MAG: LLM class F420-dependent oxidoreductase [Deltaproteobacteria bacterium]|nr:LLM class F420-dependent oxidoreductase [Deltaproteobacteria bacterium]MBW2446498.1 LLM class F420-dependent oxidoreductase [Deltaproteobacteria bacterium]